MNPMVVTKFLFFVPRVFRHVRTKGFYGCQLDHVSVDDLVQKEFDWFTQGGIFTSSMSFRLTFKDNHIFFGEIDCSEIIMVEVFRYLNMF